MTPSLRIGLVGFGSWSRDAYVPALRRSGRATIVSAAAPSDRTRQLIIEELGADVAVFHDCETLLKGPPVDAVMVAVPDGRHEAVLSTVLSAGVPVLYEPPLSHTRRHIPLMIDRILAATRATCADLELGYIPVVRRAAELVQSGAMGRMQTAIMRLRASWGAEPGNDLSTLGRLTPWYVDVLNCILGAVPQRVFVQDGHGCAGRAQNYCVGIFDYGETWGSLDINIASVGELSVSLEGHGADGEFALDLLGGQLRFRSRRSSAWAEETWPPLAPVAGWPGVHESITAFLSAVDESEDDPHNALKMASLNMAALAAEESKDSGTWAKVADLPSHDQRKNARHLADTGPLGG